MVTIQHTFTPMVCRGLQYYCWLSIFNGKYHIAYSSTFSGIWLASQILQWRFKFFSSIEILQQRQYHSFLSVPILYTRAPNRLRLSAFPQISEFFTVLSADNMSHLEQCGFGLKLTRLLLHQYFQWSISGFLRIRFEVDSH